MTPNTDYERVIRDVFEDYRLRRDNLDALTWSPGNVNQYLDTVRDALLRTLSPTASSETP